MHVHFVSDGEARDAFANPSYHTRRIATKDGGPFGDEAAAVTHLPLYRIERGGMNTDYDFAPTRPRDVFFLNDPLPLRFDEKECFLLVRVRHCAGGM